MAFNKMKHLEKLVSVFVLLGIIILITTTLLIGNLNKWFTSKNEYYTYLPSAAGIDKGIVVKLRGVGFEIGTVEDFSLTKDERILIKLSITKKYASKIRTNSVLYIKKPTIGILGKTYFEVSPGSAELPVLPSGSFIPSSKTFEGRLLIASKSKTGITDVEEESDLNLPTPIKNFLNRINYILDPNRPYLKNTEEILYRIKGILTTVDKQGLLSVIGTRRFQAHIENITRSINDITNRQIRQIMDRVVGIMTTVEATSNTVIGVRLPRIMRSLENVLIRTESVLRNLERSPIFGGGRGKTSTTTQTRSRSNRARRRGVLLE